MRIRINGTNIRTKRIPPPIPTSAISANRSSPVQTIKPLVSEARTPASSSGISYHGKDAPQVPSVFSQPALQCYDNDASAPSARTQHSSVAQWQSIRLLTEGL